MRQPLIGTLLLVPLLHHHGGPLHPNEGLLLHHHEHHPAPAPAELSFSSSLGSSSSFAELSLPSTPGSFASVVHVQAKHLAGTGYHFLVLQRDTTVFGTGRNSYGQLATGTTTNALTPQKANVSGVVDVVAGTAFSCLVVGITDRQVQCVGDGTNGVLGRGSTSSSSVLEQVSGALAGVSEVYCGPVAAFAIKLGSGQVYAWGYGSTGQLGVGSSGSQLVPAPVILPTQFNVTQVASGEVHACFLSSAGEVRCSGSNSLGRLGDNIRTSYSFTPVAVDVSLLSSPQATKFVSLSGGSAHTCATATDNKVYCWGYNNYFQLGKTVGTTNLNKPTPVAGITNARSVWAGYRNTFVINNNALGSGAVAFGEDSSGVFGLGSTPDQSATPLVFGQGVTGIVEIRGGLYATCILKQSGEVWCTGRQDFGQFGRGNQVQSLVLVKMQDFTTSAPTMLVPTKQPTTLVPTGQPTHQPTHQPTLAPTKQPTLAPTMQPTLAPTLAPTGQPTKPPTHQPTHQPTLAPTGQPTKPPTHQPTHQPTLAPTGQPTKPPTYQPTHQPTLAPTHQPTKQPTSAPTKQPTLAPTLPPTHQPTHQPTLAPTEQPTSAPTLAPTNQPTSAPTFAPTAPTTSKPTERPTSVPTIKPTKRPTKMPSKYPTKAPTKKPTKKPMKAPTSKPTKAPTKYPTKYPTRAPTKYPTKYPTKAPTSKPTVAAG